MALDLFTPIPGVISSSSPANKTAPASTSTHKMQGFAHSCGPLLRTGNLRITVRGTIIAQTSTTVNNGIEYQLYIGTGSAPANAATITGTTIGPVQTYTHPVAPTAVGDVHIPFEISGNFAGAVGTTYWVDLSAKSLTTASAVLFENVYIHCEEL